MFYKNKYLKYKFKFLHAKYFSLLSHDSNLFIKFLFPFFCLFNSSLSSSLHNVFDNSFFIKISHIVHTHTSSFNSSKQQRLISFSKSTIFDLIIKNIDLDVIKYKLDNKQFIDSYIDDIIVSLYNSPKFYNIINKINLSSLIIDKPLKHLLYNELLKLKLDFYNNDIDDDNNFINNIQNNDIFTRQYNFKNNNGSINKISYFDLNNLSNSFYNSLNPVFTSHYFNYRFITPDVVSDLKSFDLTIFNFYNYNNINISIPKSLDLDSNIFHKIILHTNIIFDFKKLFPFHNLNSNINIELLLSNAKKLFSPPSSKHSCFFSPTSINSAQFYSLPSKLTIFRKEELFKLLLHELIHYSHIDRFVDSNSSFNNIWFKHFNVHKSFSFLFSESIAETFAQLLNLLIISSLFDIDFALLFKFELLFGLFQTAKIFFLAGFTDSKQFFNSFDPSFNNKIFTSTNTVEYHIFKTIFLFNLNDFLNIFFLASNSSSNLNNISAQLLNLISDSFSSNSSFHSIINFFLNFFSSDLIDTSSFIFLSSRMSLIESL